MHARPSFMWADASSSERLHGEKSRSRGCVLLAMVAGAGDVGAEEVEQKMRLGGS